MNWKKNRLIPISFFTLIITALLTGFVFKNESRDFKLQKNLDIFYSLIRELNAFYVDEIEPDKIFKEGIDEMLLELDPFTTYYPESERDDFTFMTTGKYGGIGSLIRNSGDYTVLTQVYKGFPADESGLKEGDILKKIDDRSLKGLAIEDVSDLLKGEPNTDVNLTIERQGKDFEKSITRKRITIYPVPYFGMLDEETGYIRFTNFTQNCSADVKNALITLIEKHGAKSIVLDVRSNPGGLLMEAVEIVNLFIGPGKEVVSTKGRVKKYDQVYKTSKKAIDEDIPLAVLINQTTASSAEIVAGAIQDHDRGVVIGRRSYGKGLVQISRPLSYNATLKVTTAKYYIPSGRCIQAIDYSHRNEDGSVGYIPDSLTSVFTTKNGRQVKDGGGISPDYLIEQEKLSQFSTMLYLRNLIFDFATRFYWSNPEIESPDNFRLSDDTYKDFGEFLKEKEFTYESATQDALSKLAGVAKKEKYYDDNKELFEELDNKLARSIDTELEKFRPEITRLIEDEIIGRYYYQEGVIRHSLDEDNQVLKALEVLNDKSLYTSTLNGRNGLLSLKE